MEHSPKEDEPLSKLVPTSTLKLYLNPYQVTIEVKGRAPIRLRRHVLLLTFRALKGTFKWFKAADIHHSDGHFLNFVHEEYRGVSLYCATQILTPEQKLGSLIRTRRLQLEMSQQTLAKQAGIHSTYLSELERGKYKAKLATLNKISQALGLNIRSLAKSENPKIDEARAAPTHSRAG